MQSTIISHQQPIPPMLLAPVLPETVPASVRRPLRLQKGEQLFTESALGEQRYLMTSGELLILRNGRPVDLVEAGELLEHALWPDTTAVALTACAFEPVAMASPKGEP